MSLLIRNATVLTVDAGDRVIEDGAVYVEDGRIAAVGPSAGVEAAHAAGAGRVIDGRGKVVRRPTSCAPFMAAARGVP